jgi:hypothetical protein
MHELLLSEINKLGDAHFVCFGGIKVVLVDELEVLNEDLESIFFLDLIVSAVELSFEIFELALEILKLFGAQARRGWIKK